MFIVTGVPAIICGGITYALTSNWGAVAICQIVLLFLLSLLLVKGSRSKKKGQIIEKS
jgi:hypothetical protein